MTGVKRAARPGFQIWGMDQHAPDPATSEPPRPTPPRLVLRVARGRVVAVEPERAGAGGGAKALAGRRVAEAPGLAARLEPLCAAAHRAACAAALGALTGRPARPAGRRLAAAAAIQHGARAALVWGAMIEAPDAGAALAVRVAAAHWLRTGGPAADLAAALRAALFGLRPPLAEAAALGEWAARSGAALGRLVRAAAAGPWGRGPALRLPPMGDDPAAALTGPLAPQPFAEAGPYARLEAAEAGVLDGFGPVAARLLALALDGARLADRLAAGEAEAAFAPRAAAGGGRAAAVVRTARGPLIWRVAVEGDRIVEAATLGPSQHLFAPGGPARLLLQGAPAEPGPIALALAAADPCGDVSVVTRPAAGEPAAAR